MIVSPSTLLALTLGASAAALVSISVYTRRVRRDYRALARKHGFVYDPLDRLRIGPTISTLPPFDIGPLVRVGDVFYRTETAHRVLIFKSHQTLLDGRASVERWVVSTQSISDPSEEESSRTGRPRERFRIDRVVACPSRRAGRELIEELLCSV